MKKGFTLIELLVVIGVLVIVLAISITAFFNLTKKTNLDVSRENIISTLNTARNKSIASEAASQYGVYLDTSTEPDRYIFFRGPSYAQRSVSYDKIYVLPSSIIILNLNFNGGGNEIVFKRLDGNTNNYGSLTIKSLSTNEIRNIYIYSSGQLSLEPESVSGPGRITDSRHVHFDLGWGISEAATLKFDFINAGKIEQIPMAEYFTSTSFDWEGEFTINNATQEFRIHTYQLSPSTLLCIHRDRNKGKNTEEVYVYIIQGGTEKEIAHYDNDQYATVYKGASILNTPGMEVQ